MSGIRQLKKEEVEAFIRLSEFAFQYEMSEEHRAKRMAEQDPAELWGYFEGDKLAAKLQLLPLAVWVGGKSVPMGGIASVSTWPEYRRNGYVGQLLAHSYAVMREQGMLISMLSPFSIPFYRKFGYEVYVERKQYEIEAADLPRFGERSGHVERTDDVHLLDGIYRQYAKMYNGMLDRSPEWWNRRLAGKPGLIHAVWFDAAREPRGYLSFSVKDRVMQVDEMVFLDETARRGLWSLIANHDSMIGKVRLIAPAGDPLPYLLPNPRFKQELFPYFMARIIDAPAFIQQYTFRATGKAATLLLHLKDDQAEWNNGCFRITVDGQGAAQAEVVPHTVDGGGGEKEAVQAGLSCDIRALTAVLLGYQQPALLHQTGKLQGSAEEVRLLAQLLPQRETFFLDHF